MNNNNTENNESNVAFKIIVCVITALVALFFFNLLGRLLPIAIAVAIAILFTRKIFTSKED